MSKVKVPGGAFYAGEGLEVDLASRTVSAGGGGGVQSDWNQSDETASDYVKNRPGGYTSWTAKTPTTKVKTFKSTSDAGKFKTDDVVEYFGEFGSATAKYNKVDVVFNGVEYKDVDIDKNSAIGDENLEKYPFYLNVNGGSAGGGMRLFCNYSSIEGDVEITVQIYDKSIVKIPSEYIDPMDRIQVDDSTGYEVAAIEGKQAPYAKFVGVKKVDGVKSTYIYGANLDCGYGAGEVKPIIVNGGYMKLKGYNSNTVQMVLQDNAIIIKSSTSNSSKYFKITVDDSGTVTATETTV